MTGVTVKLGATSLMYACQQGKESQVNEIIQTKPDTILERERSLKTALHYCAESGDGGVESAAALLRAAPELVFAQDQDGYTALHLAVIAGNVQLAKLLISQGADVNTADKEGHTSAHWATVCGEIECLELILKKKADPNIGDMHGGCPLHYAAQMCGPGSEMPGDRRLGMTALRLLINHFADPNIADHHGRTPILWAASAGSSEAILVLTNAGANVEAADKDGLTALHCAASRGHTDCVETLISLCNAEADVIDNNGCSALFYAVTLGHADCTQTLLNHGANTNRQDRKGRTAMHCGAAKGQMETLKVVWSRGGNLWTRTARGDYPLHEAVTSSRTDLVLWLLSLRPDAITAPNNDGRCPLHLAAIHNNVEMCKVLLDAGSLVNPVMRTAKGMLATPLDAALHKGHRGTAKYLQVHGGVPAARLNSESAALRGPNTRNLGAQSQKPLDNEKERGVGEQLTSKKALHPPLQDNVQISGQKKILQVYVEDGVMIRRIKHPQGGEGEERIKRRRRKRKTKYLVDKNYLRNKEKHGRKGYEESTDGDGYTSQDSSIGEGRARAESDSDPNYTKPLEMKDGSHTLNKNINHTSLPKEGTPSEDIAKNKDFVEINDIDDSTKENQHRSEVEIERESQINLKPLDSSVDLDSLPIKEIVEAEIHAQKIEIERNEIGEIQSENKDPNSLANRDNSEALNENLINSENTQKEKTFSPMENDYTANGSPKKIEGDGINTIPEMSYEKTTENDDHGVFESLYQSSNLEIEKSDQNIEFKENNNLKAEELLTQKDGNENDYQLIKTENDELREEAVSLQENQSIKAENEEDKKEKNNISYEENKISEIVDGSVNETDMKNQTDDIEDFIQENQETVMENSKADVISEQNEGIEEKGVTSRESGDENHEQVGRDEIERVNDLPDENMEQDDGSKTDKSLNISNEKEENSNFEKQQLSEEAYLETIEGNVSTDSQNFKSKDGNQTKEGIQSEQIEENIDIEDEDTGEKGYDDETIVDDSTEKIFDEETEDSNEVKTNQDDTLTGNELETHESSILNEEHKSDKESSSNDTGSKSSVENSMVKEVVPKESNEEASYKSDFVSEKFIENKNNRRSQKHHVSKSKRIDNVKKDRGLIKVLSDEKLPASAKKEEKIKSKHKEWKKQRSSESWEISSMSPKIDEDSYLSGNRSPTEPPLLQDIDSEQAARKEKYDQDANSKGKSRIPRMCNKGHGDKKNDIPTVSVTQAVQYSVRKYHLERRIFHQLLELKRLQIRAGRASEGVLVKRLVDDYRRAGLMLGLQQYNGVYTFRAFEKYLYDQLRLLQSSERRIIPRLKSSDDLEKLTAALRKTRVGQDMLTSIPIKKNHHTMPKPGSFLPKLVNEEGHSELAKTLRFVDPSRPLTLELSHGSEKQVITLPTEKLDKSKRYFVTFTIKTGNQKKPDGSHAHTHASSV
ncbi:unnamed protein product [Nezara viridula]|uniref:Uncharacterized protein n=1 Tax=Nezara viridula TaxID=85310 RepID=A0A9P0EAF7_NEZVI|nr:unnamed protein product [Nezara viridula]